MPLVLLTSIKKCYQPQLQVFSEGGEKKEAISEICLALVPSSLFGSVKTLLSLFLVYLRAPLCCVCVCSIYSGV